MDKISIMIVEDHALIRDTWSLLLGLNSKYEVIAALGDGQQAIEMARDKRPNIVLLDINMQPMNGFEVLKMILQLSPTSKVIGVSMHSEPVYAKKMIRGGAKGYLTKNSPREELMKAIDHVFEGKVYICEEVKKILAENEILADGDGDSRNISSLSPRELEAIGHVRDGLSSKEIADKMNISVKTVEVHRYNILKKLKVKNTAGLINLMNTHGL